MVGAAIEARAGAISGGESFISGLSRATELRRLLAEGGGAGVAQPQYGIATLERLRAWLG